MDPILAQMQAEQGQDPDSQQDPLIAQMRQEQTASAALAVGTATGDANKAAANAALAKRYNTTPEVVGAFPDDFRQRLATETAAAALKQAPALADHINANPNLAQMVHDDVPNTAALQPAIAALKPSLLGDLWTGVNFTGLKILGAWDKAAVALNDMFPDGTPGKFTPQEREFYLGRGAYLQQEAQAAPPQRWTGQVTSGLTYAPFMAAAPVVAGGTEGTARSQELQDKGVDATTAAEAGTGEGALQAGIQMLPLGRLLLGQGLGALAKSTLGATAKAGAAGAGQSIASDTIASELLRSGGYNDVAQQYQPSSEKAWDSALFMAGLHLGTQGIHAAVDAARPPVPAQLQADVASAAEAERTASVLGAVSELSSASKLRERSPDAFKQVVQSMAEGQVDHVYVEAAKLQDVLTQGGVTPDELRAKLPDVAEQLPGALQASGDVRIPIADYATHIAGGPIDAALLPHLKTDPAGMTYQEAQDFYGTHASQMVEAAKEALAPRANPDLPFANEAEAVKAGLTPADYTELTTAHQQAVDEALAAMNQRSARDATWMTNATDRERIRLTREAETQRAELRDQAAKETGQEPIEQARKFLQTGEYTNHEGEQIRAERGFKLDSGALKPEDAAKLGKLTEKGGVHPDTVAEMFELRSGEHLVRELAHGDSFDTKVEGLVERRMLEQHGELADEHSIQRAAEKAIANEARGRFMATGLKVLAKSPIPARELLRGAREAAEAKLAVTKVGDVDVRQHMSAEVRNGRLAIKLAPRDPAGAVKAQRAALINHELVRASVAARDDIKDGVRYAEKFSRPGVRKSIDVDIRNQIDDLLARFDFRQYPNDDPTRAQLNLRQWVEAQVEAGYTPKIPEELLSPSYRKPYREMTVAEFRDLMGTIKSMEFMGRERNQITVEGRRQSLDAFVQDELVPKMQDIGEKFSAEELYSKAEDRGLNRFQVGLDRLASWWRQAGASLKPQEFKRNMLDRHELAGPFGRAVFERIFDANYRKMDMLKELSNSFAAKAEELGKDWQDSLRNTVDNDALIDKLTSTPTAPRMMRFTRGRMLMLALHSGNESNFDKLVRGYGWRPADVVRFLGKNMTAKDIDAVNHIWALYDKHWPQTAAMYERLGQTLPPKIPAREMTLPAGKLTGGYAHIDYDPLRARQGQRAGASRAKEIAANGTSVADYFRRTGTTNGAMNARIEGYTDAINLDFHTIERALQATIHDLAYRESLVDVNKILEHPQFKQEFLKAYGRENMDALHTWLGRIANSNNADRDTEALTKVLAYTRTGMVMNAIALRASTVAKHGGSAGIKTMGYFVGGGEQFLAPRMAAMAHDYKNQIATAIEKFPEIRARLMMQDRDFKQTASSLFEADNLRNRAERFGHAAVAWADMMTAVPTAHAAYDRAVTVGIPEGQGGTGVPMSESDAVKYASKIVREAHGSNIESARSNVMTSQNEAVKMFTVLYQFMNNTYGQMADAADKLRTANVSKPEVLARSFAALIVPALWAGYLKGSPSDKHEGWAAWVAKSIGEEFAATVPLVRDAGAMAEGYAHAGQVAAESWLATMVQAVHSATTGKGKPIQHIADAVGMGLHIPGLGQAGKTAQYLEDVHTGKRHPRSTAEAVKGATIGGTPPGR